MNKIIAILISAFLAGQTLAATVINVYPTNITTTSAYFQATISTNGGGSTGTVFYGFSDQTTNASSWSMSNDYGNITTTGTVSKQITNLQQAQKYYYRWRILETGTYVWAAGTSNFWTKAASPTSTPTPVSISVQANPTTAALMAPTNFFNANTGLLETALSELFATDADVAAEESRAVSVEQQLGAAVTNLNTATNSLDTRADALETSTGALNTAVATLNTATGSLNSAVSDLNAATGSLNSAVANILTATGALNSAVADLQISTGTLNTAVSALNSATGSLNTAVGTLNTATNDLNGRVTDLESGGDAAGWSGFAATQEVSWSYATPIVATNISVTGSGLNPDVSGVYTYGGLNEGQSYWSSTNGYYIFVINLEHPAYMICNNMYSVPDEYFYRGDGAGPVGSYDPNTPYVAGTPVAVYSYVTNTYDWEAGPDPDDGQAWKLTLGGTNIYRAYAASNVFDKPIYGDGANISGVNATNAVTLAGLLASDYAKQANYAATSNLVDLTKSIADGLNSVSSMVNRVTTADYPATSNLVDLTKSIADGLNSRSNVWDAAAAGGIASLSNTGAVTGAITLEGECVTQTNTAFNFAVPADYAAATGALNSAVAQLQTDTGTIWSAVGALQTDTGTLNTAVGNLVTATGSLDTAVSTLNTATGSLNTAVATLNTATNALNDRLTIAETNFLPLAGGTTYGPVTNNVLWLTNNAKIYFGTSTNFIQDLGGTNYLFQAGTNWAVFGW